MAISLAQHKKCWSFTSRDVFGQWYLDVYHIMTFRTNPGSKDHLFHKIMGNFWGSLKLYTIIVVMLQYCHQYVPIVLCKRFNNVATLAILQPVSIDIIIIAIYNIYVIWLLLLKYQLSLTDQSFSGYWICLLFLFAWLC